MTDRHRLLKWVLIVFLVAVALLVLYPPDQRLKGGIDLVGGTRLIFAIDTTGMEARQKSDLANRVINILRNRIDPNNQMNLVWRPIGNNRLEVQMPRPPDCQPAESAPCPARDGLRPFCRRLPRGRR